VLGEKLTQADIDLEATQPALLLLTDFARTTNYTGPVQLISGSPVATQQLFSFSQHATQHASLSLARKVDALLTEHPQLILNFQYAKRSPALVGFKRARQLALEAVRRPLTNTRRPPSLHFQRAENKSAAFVAWGELYRVNPRQSQAYNSALTNPPDGQAHTILRIASTGIKRKGQTLSHRVSRETQATLIRLITGHAFLGAYRLRFQRKNLPPATEEEVACACGAVPEDTEHVLLHCPLTHDQCMRHLSADGQPDSLRKIFDSPKRCLGLLRFLEETCVCAKRLIRGKRKTGAIGGSGT